MIPKQDLRIGNSVMLFLGIDDYGAQFRIVKIFGINSDIIGDITIRIDDTDHWHPLDNIHPIPITEEALVKMGFEEQENNWKCLIICDDWSYLYWEKLAGFKISVNSYSLMLPYVNSIHQLQNIIYALTNTELSYEGESTKS